MALKIRLQRFGSKRRPFYDVVVTDSRNPRNGRFIERIGFYSSRVNPSVIQIKTDRYEHWYAIGARPTDPVKALVRAAKKSSTPA